MGSIPVSLHVRWLWYVTNAQMGRLAGELVVLDLVTILITWCTVERVVGLSCWLSY